MVIIARTVCIENVHINMVRLPKLSVSNFMGYLKEKKLDARILCRNDWQYHWLRHRKMIKNQADKSRKEDYRSINSVNLTWIYIRVINISERL